MILLGISVFCELVPFDIGKRLDGIEGVEYSSTLWDSPVNELLKYPPLNVDSIFDLSKINTVALTKEKIKLYWIYPSEFLNSLPLKLSFADHNHVLTGH